MPRIDRLLLIAAIFLMPMASKAGDRSFNRIVHRLEAHYGKAPTLNSGFMNFMASCFAPSGVGHIKMAVFDELDASKGPLCDELKDMVDPDYRLLVQVRSRKDGENVYVFLRETGKRAELLVLSAEATEAVVLKMRLNPDALEKWIQDPVEMTKKQERHPSKESPEAPSPVASSQDE